ncbi:MAG: SDR family oxidoreductase [Pseudomonadota bacterium]
MTVVITGASGHVGGVLTRTLIKQRRHVRVLVHKDTRALDDLRVQRVEADILKPDTLAKAFQGAGTVYHLAAHISIEGGKDRITRMINVEGTSNVVDACIEANVEKLVHFSSIHALNACPKDQEIDETREYVDTGDCYMYDRTKAEAERIVLMGVKRGLFAVIVNPTGIIGPLDFKPSHMGQVLVTMYQGKLPALMEGGFNWVDVRDVVTGAMAAEQRGRRGQSYLLSGHWMALKDLARLIHEVTGVKQPTFVSPYWLARLGAPFAASYNRLRGKPASYTSASISYLQDYRYISCEKAQTELGYRPRSMRETIEDTYKWFKQAGRLEKFTREELQRLQDRQTRLKSRLQQKPKPKQDDELEFVPKQKTRPKLKDARMPRPRKIPFDELK